jgi:alpha-L-fucosidase 2
MAKTFSLIAITLIALSSITLFVCEAADVAEPNDEWAEVRTILEESTGIFHSLPKEIETSRFTDAPVLGNGEIGVAVGGTPKRQTLLLNRIDFWVRALGSLQISTAAPGTTSPIYRYKQDIAKAEVRAEVTIDGNPTRLTSWVAVNEPMLVTRLENCSNKPVVYNVAFHDVPENGAGLTEKSVGHNNQMAWANRSFFHVNYSTPHRWNIFAASVVFRIFGNNTTTYGDSSATVTIQPRSRAIIATMLPGRGGPAENIYSEQFRGPGQKRLLQLDEAILRRMENDRDAWWRRFWLKSYVNLGDTRMNQFWYGAYYALACCSRTGQLCPGLWGVWIASDHPEWGGSYFCNYNVQSVFYGAFSGNRPELADSYFDTMSRYLPLTPAAAAGYRGAIFPRVFGLNHIAGGASLPLQPVAPTKIAPTKRRNGLCNDQLDSTAFLAINFINRWRYTRDVAFLKQRAWPFMIASADFYEDYLTLENGRYVLRDSGAREGCPNDVNACYSLAMIKFVFRSCLEVADQMGVNESQQKKWRHIVQHLSDYPTAEVNGMTVFKEAENSPRILLEGPGDNVSLLQMIQPAEAVGLDSDRRMLEIARNTIRYANSNPRKLSWNQANNFPQIFAQAAYVGWDADDLYRRFYDRLGKELRPNLTVREGGGGVETCGATEAVNAMLLQSHEGMLRFFPVWPKSKDAKFVRLRAVDAMVVSAALKKGIVTDVQILSEKGGDCTVLNPWPGCKVQIIHNGRAVELAAGERFTLKTKSGETIELKREPAAVLQKKG